MEKGGKRPFDKPCFVVFKDLEQKSSAKKKNCDKLHFEVNHTRSLSSNAGEKRGKKKREREEEIRPRSKVGTFYPIKR